MPEQNDLCEFLKWDSAFFNCQIGRIKQERATEEELKQILEWGEKNQIDCLYFLVNSGDSATTKLAEDVCFHMVDARVTLTTNLAPRTPQKDSVVREARIEDIDKLKEIASTNHRDSRFYYDGHFSTRKCDEFFGLWVENSFKSEFADIVLVTSEGDSPSGYITCSVNEDGSGNIDLVGVSPQSRGKGIGRMLVSAALDWFAGNGVSRISVVTQGRNIAAQRLYQKNGFLTDSLKIWYHHWSKQCWNIGRDLPAPNIHHLNPFLGV